MILRERKRPKVSVIVAAYNCELTIEKCLFSIIKQTLKEVEIIVVDDSSTDETAKIIRHYAEKYDYIYFYENKKNMGAGYTKNVALEKARGEYIGFVDSDDFIDSDYYKDLYDAGIKFGADVICTNIDLIYSDKTIRSHIDENEVMHDGIVNETKVIKAELVVSHWSGASACTKLIQKSLICKYPFFEGRCCDDIPTVIPSLLNANKIVYHPFHYYHYVQRAGSLERSGFNSHRLDVAISVRLTCDRVRQLLYGDVACRILFSTSILYTFIELLKIENIDYINTFYQQLNYQDDLKNYLVPEKNVFLKNNLDMWTPIGVRLYYEKAVELFSKGRLEELKQHISKWKNSPERFCPKVSIVIPVYNGANYMRDAIGSALAQTYPNIEVIVVNDGSTDSGETDRIARSYGDRIRYINKSNGGVATALNAGIENMTGDYFAWLSHDDMYTYDKIEREIEFLFKQPNKTVFVAGGYTVVDANGKTLYDVNLHKMYTDDQIKKPLFAVMRGGINGCAVLIHKSHFLRVGMFNPNLPTTQDYDLWFRILRGQSIAYYEGCYVKSRSHDEQDSKKLITSHIAECDNLWISMIENLSEEEKCQISDTVLDFYIETKDFIVRNTGYVNVANYLWRCIIREFIKEVRHDYLHIKRFAKEINIPKHILMQKAIKSTIESVKTKPRIAFLLPFPNELGGLNRIVLQMASLLTVKYEILLVVDDLYDESGYPLCRDVIQVKAPKITENAEVLPKLLAILDVDICIISYNCAPSFLNLYKPLRSFGIKTIAWSHEFYFLPYWNTDLYKCLSMKNNALSCANAVIWLNSTSASFYSQLHDNALIMPNMITMESFESARRHQKKNIIAVGRFDDQRKGLKELLQVFKKISIKNESVELYVVGPYDLGLNVPGNEGMTYEMLIRKLNLPLARIHFTGWIKDVEQYYEMACLHLMTSLYEGFGLAITESASYGIPSVIFEGSGLDDIINDGVDGYIIPQGNLDEMAEKIIDLLEDNEKLNQMSLAASKIIHKYSKDKIVSRWENLIELVLHYSMDQQAELNIALRENFMFKSKNQQALFKQAIQEYENCIRNLLASRVEVTNETGDLVYYPLYDGAYQQECIDMMNSFSWKITKPLRLIRKTQLSLKKSGLKETLKKVKRKLFVL